MGTRGIIARVTGDGFTGRYHHWDSYPTQLGKTLYDNAQRFGVGSMLRTLLDDHPAGWSTINGYDLDQPAGYRDGERREGEGPICYCHGARSEEAQALTDKDDAGAEWAYAFSKDGATMAVLERGDGWAIRAVVQLDGPEPEWAAIECGVNLERCKHYGWVHDPTICRGCDGLGVRAGGGHRLGFGGCALECVPDADAPEALRENDPAWHVYKPKGGFVCMECGGSGKAR